VGVAFGLAAATAGAADPDSCKLVRLSDISWTDVTATTTLTAMILRELGYQPKIVLSDVAGTYRGLKTKDLDAFLGNWMPSMEPDRKPFIDDHSVDVLNANLEGAKYTLAVPAYLYDKGLHDFADIAKFGKDLDFKIYGIEPGNDGNRHVLDMIKDNRFGLGAFKLVESSEQGMLAELAKDYRASKPVVFLGWEPHPMNKNFKISYLTGGDDTFGPNYGNATVYTNVRGGYASECANVAKLLSNEKFSLAAEDDMMDMILNRRMDPAKAVAIWAHNHKDEITPWLDGVTTFDGKPGLAAVQARL
jgi:glycine betaine/proline transport system substrate-binding protein